VYCDFLIWPIAYNVVYSLTWSLDITFLHINSSTARDLPCVEGGGGNHRLSQARDGCPLPIDTQLEHAGFHKIRTENKDHWGELQRCRLRTASIRMLCNNCSLQQWLHDCDAVTLWRCVCVLPGSLAVCEQNVKNCFFLNNGDWTLKSIRSQLADSRIPQRDYSYNVRHNGNIYRTGESGRVVHFKT